MLKLNLTFTGYSSFKPNTFLRFGHHDANYWLMGHVLCKLRHDKLSCDKLCTQWRWLWSSINRIIFYLRHDSICYYFKQKYCRRIFWKLVSFVFKWSIINKLEYFHNNLNSQSMLNLTFTGYSSFKPNTFLRLSHHDANYRLMGHLFHKLRYNKLSSDKLCTQCCRLWNSFHRIILSFRIITICYYV